MLSLYAQSFMIATRTDQPSGRGAAPGRRKAPAALPGRRADLPRLVATKRSACDDRA